MARRKKTRYIFVCGGVLSGVGKGIVASSIGFLLKSKGFNVTAIKIDPYLNIDAGLMRPAEHGEVFITEDRGEIDQDLGNYERFLGTTFSKNQNITSGKIYQNIIEKERRMEYGGRDVEFFPDVIDEIKLQIHNNIAGEDFVLVEIGGTTGDVENMAFLHAAREMSKENGGGCFIMVTYLPLLKMVGELKTKPTQHAVARLREMGILPDFIVTRNEIPIDQPRRETISKRCFINEDNIIDNPDLETIYQVPLKFEEARFADKILAHFEMKPRRSDIRKMKRLVNTLLNSKKLVRIGIVGKYVTHGALEHKDTYISVLEAIKHAAGAFGYKPEIELINAEQFAKDPESVTALSQFNGIVVPQGWGSRGAEGKITAIKYVRENKIPYLGLCYGMQMASIEFARNVLRYKDANSEEVDPATKHPIIHIMPDQKQYLKENQFGGTIRLGGWDCKLKKGTLVYEIYKKHKAFKNTSKSLISERHRHRYEFNNEYKKEFEKAGFVFSGTSPDGRLVEFIELPKEKHPFFIGTQAHPEYKSGPLNPHPIFAEFVRTAITRQK